MFSRQNLRGISKPTIADDVSLAFVREIGDDGRNENRCKIGLTVLLSFQIFFFDSVSICLRFRVVDLVMLFKYRPRNANLCALFDKLVIQHHRAVVNEF
jgi:hypothetical protein